MFGNDPNEKNTVHAMLEFAEDLDECRKIQFAKFVCLLTVSQVSAVEITELTKLLVSRYFPTLHSSLFCHGRRKTLAHSILAVIVTIARGHQTRLSDTGNMAIFENSRRRP